MRRAALVALLFFAFAPAAHAGCGVTSTALTGAAPLVVTFTAACATSTYAWSFGDGDQGVGQTVQHVYAKGSWRPTLTTEAGVEATPAVTAISLTLAAPRVARYAQWVTLRATVAPRVPVTLRGRRFVNGKLRVRVLGTAPWIAQALGVESTPARILVAPKLVVRFAGRPLLGAPVRVIAMLHPASAGAVTGPTRIDTRTVHVAHVHLSSRPARGWTAARVDASVPIVAPLLSLGARGASVRALEQRLADLHYAIRRDGYFGSEDLEAVYAFQKVEGLDRTGMVTPGLWSRLLNAKIPRARYGGGDHVEIDKTRQVLFLVRGGEVALVIATSTGATGNTPLGAFHVYRKVNGFDWVLYYPSYFLRGFAVHGYPDVPPYPASHGCARIPMWIAQTVSAQIAYGSEVIVYT
jgi:L,D-transpeptidase catalytic domain/Putative peptidoglycan binding domain/PKD domain